MTARQPRRARRRAVAASPLPRPSATLPVDAEQEEQAATPASVRAARRAGVRHREHHVTKDYSYVHKDLLTVLAIGVVIIGFIVGMSFIPGI